MTQPSKTNGAIILTPLQEREFNTAIKVGLYKELHKKGLLSDAQLTKLILMQNK